MAGKRGGLDLMSLPGVRGPSAPGLSRLGLRLASSCHDGSCCQDTVLGLT